MYGKTELWRLVHKLSGEWEAYPFLGTSPFASETEGATKSVGEQGGEATCDVIDLYIHMVPIHLSALVRKGDSTAS